MKEAFYLFSSGAPLRILCHQTRPIEALLRDEHMLATSLNMYFTISEGGLQHHQEPDFVRIVHNYGDFYCPAPS
jgi:hypothetical protein